MSHSKKTEREHQIIRTSVIGILVNLFLVIFKAIVGLMANSIAIILDAVNNFSDMLSSLVTIVGMKLARRAPDRNHPLGHGRSEYLSAVFVAIIIGYIGITALIESINKIISPEPVHYSVFTVIVVIVAIITKIILSVHVMRVGKKYSSAALEGSGKDALSDALISIATLSAIIIHYISHINIEPYLAAVISLVIIKTGYDLIRDTFSVILGERADKQLTVAIKKDIAELEGVKGAFDLIIHDYGPDRTVASVNIEVPYNYTASDIDELSRHIRKRIYRKYNILIASVGIYSINTKNPTIRRMYDEVKSLLNLYNCVQSMHGFYVDLEEKEISFDVVMNFSTDDYSMHYREICRALKEKYPDFKTNISLDADFSD